MKKTDVVIIGSGIAGIVLSIYLKRSNVDFVLLEGKIPGGKLTKISKIENFPGYVSISGLEFQLDLLKQLKHLNISITYGMVQSVLKEPEGFEVISDIDSYTSKVVVIATGSVLQTSGIKNVKDYFGRGVSYCATCDGNFFKGLPVAVYGNNNIALEEALYLSNLASKVYLVVNSDKLLGDNSLIDDISKTKNIEIRLSTYIDEVIGDEYGVSSILTNSNEEIHVSGLFPYAGDKSSIDFLKSLLVSNENGYIKVDEKMMSSVSGLFAIGDIVNKKVRQLVTASGDAATASHYIVQFLKEIKK